MDTQVQEILRSMPLRKWNCLCCENVTFGACVQVFSVRTEVCIIFGTAEFWPSAVGADRPNVKPSNWEIMLLLIKLKSLCCKSKGVNYCDFCVNIQILC